MSSQGGDSPKRTTLHHDVCRDFLNKICNRSRCKFYHPADDELHLYDKKMSSGISTERAPQDYHFCYEFQSSSDGCMRATCRFLHCSKSASDHFTKTGQIDLEMAKAIVAQDTGLAEVSDRPLCKEFLNNKCRRAEKCRFWHINPIHEQQERIGVGKKAKTAGARYYSSQETPGSRYGAQSPKSYYDQYSDSKRPKYLYDSQSYHGQTNPQSAYNSSTPGSVQYAQTFGSPPAQYQVQSPVHARESMGESSLKSILLAENVELNRTYELLLKTVNDLRASNESLLSENTALRTTWQHVTGHAVNAGQPTGPDVVGGGGGLVDQSNLLSSVVYYK